MAPPVNEFARSSGGDAAQGDALWAAGDAIGAIAAYARALAADRHDARSAMNLAHALAACGNRDAALQWMRHAHAIDPQIPCSR